MHQLCYLTHSQHADVGQTSPSTDPITSGVWQGRHHSSNIDRSFHQLDRAAQVTIFRLRTGHCQLLSHLHRLNISHSDECPCGTGPQTPNHILQSCPTFDSLRRQTWPSPVEAHRKLWGPVETLRQTADFALLISSHLI